MLQLDGAFEKADQKLAIPSLSVSLSAVTNMHRQQTKKEEGREREWSTLSSLLCILKSQLGPGWWSMDVAVYLLTM